ncbi:MAG: serine/threonine-protein kinase [Myxococcota bacterium]
MTTRDHQTAGQMPERLGRYRLVRAISTGGMARVYEARREAIEGVAPRVALKVILPKHAKDDAYRQLFINEARVGSMLRHQNLVAVQDFDAAEGLFYLVMEYVEGVTLRQAIREARKRGAMIPLTVIAEVGRQVCDGLHHAHSAQSGDGRHLQLVHRDLKPSNLMLNPQGVAKLLDFGISKAHMTEERPGAIRGTWGYMSPEQAAGAAIGPPADLFGLAAVLYEMAALQPLVSEKKPDEIRALLARDEAARRASRLSGQHGPLASVLVRALQRDPLARYPSAGAMGRALSALAGDPVVAREHLVRFQKFVVQARSAAAAPERRVSASSAAPEAPDDSGLPLRVGDVHGVAPAKEITAPTPQRTGVIHQVQTILAALFIGAAIGIIGFTAWKIVDQQPGVPAAPAPALTNTSPDDIPPPPERVTPPEPTPTEDVTLTKPGSKPPPQPAPQPLPQPAPDPDPSAVPDPTPVEVAPEPVAIEAPASTAGMLTVSAHPRAKVMLDGEFVQMTPLYAHMVPAGAHTITLISEDGVRTTFTVDVVADQEVRRIWSFEENRWLEE